MRMVLKKWPEVEFTDDGPGCTFTARVPLPTPSGEGGRARRDRKGPREQQTYTPIDSPLSGGPSHSQTPISDLMAANPYFSYDELAERHSTVRSLAAPGSIGPCRMSSVEGSDEVMAALACAGQAPDDHGIRVGDGKKATSPSDIRRTLRSVQKPRSDAYSRAHSSSCLLGCWATK